MSSLGQPLRAEIELTAVSADEAGALVAKLAPSEAFRLANIDFNPTLLSLRFEVEQRGGRSVIRISSGQPVNEPFVDMLLELNWTGGRMVREYTFLLDPADMRSTQSAQVAAPVEPKGQAAPARAAQPANAAQTAAQNSQSAPPSQAAAAPARGAARPAPERQSASEYKVKSGDNLSRIAGQLKPVDVSLDLMLVALYRANPEAFSGKNMNRLKSGQILAVPDADAIRAGGSEGEARGVVVAHAADFNAYRAKLAGQVAMSAPAKEAEAGQNAAGKITAKVEERPTAANEAKDQLKLSKAAPTASATGRTAVASVEDKIAKEKQVAEAAARVKELEKNVNDLEKLMAVKSKAAADAKKASASASAASLPMIDLNAPASASAVASASAPEPKQPKRIVVPPRTVEPSLLDTLTDNITYIGVAVVALLAGAGGLIASRRRRGAIDPGQPDANLLGEAAPVQPLFAETGGQSVDTTSNSVFNSNFAPSASQLDTNEVDPVAEADVYIAYGRDAQAEEILKEALRSHPERMPVRLKLLEIYATRKDARAFETQATELFAQTKGQGDEWAQAVALGLTLDPYNPLYAGQEQGDSAPAAAIPAAAAVGAAAYGAGQDDPLADLDGFREPEAANPANPAAGALDLDLSQDAAPAADNGMDFGSDNDFATALPAEVVAAAPAAPAADADHFLDFDLGGLSLDPVPASAVADTPKAAAEADSGFDLSLDAVEAITPAPAPAASPADDLGMDFGLDLPEAATAAPAPLPSVGSDPLADLDMMDFDIPAAPAPAPAASTAADDLAGLPGLDDFAPPTASAAPAAADTAPEFDLSGIDLDLDQGKAGAPAASAAALPEEEMSALHMEMDTKLDLAIAYQEIGDKEGARELLDEVLRGGSDSQVSKANAMRAQLG